MKTEHTRSLTMGQARRAHRELAYPRRSQMGLEVVGVTVADRWTAEDTAEGV